MRTYDNNPWPEGSPQDRLIRKCCTYFFQAHQGLRHIETEEDLYYYVSSRLSFEKGELMEEPMNNRIMRMMAWERAKGEMNAMLQTYFNNAEKWQQFGKAFKEFVKLVEQNGMQE